MATAILSELTPQQHHTAVILARLAAQKAVRRPRQRVGIKGSLPASVWSRLAIQHLQANPHLLVEAAADPLVQILGKTIRRRRPDPKQELLCKSQVQIGGEQ
jgi:hypothetical protein